MQLKPLRTEQDYEAALLRLEMLWDAPVGTSKGDELEILSILVERYEEQHHPMPPSDPVEAIKFLMEQRGLTPRDLEPYIGSSGRVSEILNRKRSLSMAMIKRLHKGLRIPYESLLA